MEKIVMYLKKVIILLCGIVLGHQEEQICQSV